MSSSKNIPTQNCQRSVSRRSHAVSSCHAAQSQIDNRDSRLPRFRASYRLDVPIKKPNLSLQRRCRNWRPPAPMQQRCHLFALPNRPMLRPMSPIFHSVSVFPAGPDNQETRPNCGLSGGGRREKADAPRRPTPASPLLV